MRITHISPPKGSFEIEIPNIAPDKSISHRSAIFSLLSSSPARIRRYLQGEDTLHTLQIAQQIGLEVTKEGEEMIFTPPPSGIKEPFDVLDCGNAGTAIRLYVGLLAASKGYFVLNGDAYLRRRPMNRVVKPLQSVGAQIFGRDEGNLAPLTILGRPLAAFDYQSPIASAQVKSAMILAALQGEEASFFSEPERSRDHTERMLRGMGARIDEDQEGRLTLFPLLGKRLDPLEMTIPADPSSAFFFAVAAAIIPGARVKLQNVLLNPTRIEAFKVLESMGARLHYSITSETYETIGDIEVSHHTLQGITVSERISWLIDELPALAIAMALAQGKSRVQNAKELRVKESDRISVVVNNLRLLGVEVEEFEDGYEITGGTLQGGVTIDSHGDHRIAMSFALAGLVVPLTINDSACIDVSFPNFLEILSSIAKVTHESQTSR